LKTIEIKRVRFNEKQLKMNKSKVAFSIISRITNKWKQKVSVMVQCSSSHDKTQTKHC